MFLEQSISNPQAELLSSSNQKDTVPEEPEMIEAAESAVRPEWGIMTVDQSGNVKVIKEPARLKIIRREDALSNIIIKLLGDSVLFIE